MFTEITLGELDAMGAHALDKLPFGVVGLSADGTVQGYNETESRLAGLPVGDVMGRHFFHAVAPCMNNFMVAERFEEEEALDEIIDYVLTFRMRPTPVRLRLLKAPGAARRYLLIER